MMTSAEARRAIYLDFETTRAASAKPALLGVLEPDAVFTQFILEPALHDGRRASNSTRAAALTEVLNDLAAALRARDAVWCSWSTFDMTVIRSSGLESETVRTFEDRYRNALDLVPRWAMTYGFRPDRARFESRNQMHRFFELAGYRPDWRYGQATPAKWIRHVRPGMEAAGGNYRQISKLAKKRWHLLLQYNRHDCLGLRHLVMRAAAELEERENCLAAEYVVRNGAKEIRFRIGSQKSSIDALLRSSGATTWAHLTASNPSLTRPTAPENAARHERLKAELKARGHATLPANVRALAGDPPADESLFIIGIGREEARTLAREFGQWAVVVGAVGGRSELVWCLDPGPDPLIVSQSVLY